MTPQIRVTHEPRECAALWRVCRPDPVELFDRWDVRACFHRTFQRPLHFRVAQADGRPVGLLPLAWVEEAGTYAFFPGETWRGRTWLEGNRIFAPDEATRSALLEAAPDPLDLRYLDDGALDGLADMASVDELNYRFLPGQVGYAYANYLQRFSSKAWKKIRRELDALEARGVAWRLDHRPDLDRMFVMNIENYGEASYFSDKRFLQAFLDLADLLAAEGSLRVTTALVAGEVAAVDMGALWHGSYTLLAGATAPAFPGVAKLINLHHIERACRERFHTVDFLCGDFGWKERFHLVARPLYRIATPAFALTECEKTP